MNMQLIYLYMYVHLLNLCLLAISMVIFTNQKFSYVLFLFVGFNNFMEDVRMMLGKRPLEPFWFFTWCISGPIITLVNL